ncbi:MAG: hypothetical protein IRY95_05600, partial [Clostridia bacterium]|nr:hypothetical protein [Clostridia bacterium]
LTAAGWALAAAGPRGVGWLLALAGVAAGLGVLATLGRRWAQAGRAIRVLALETGVGPRADPDRLAAARRRLHADREAAEARAAAEARVAEAEDLYREAARESEERAQEVRRREADQKVEEEAWRTWKRQRALPEALSPDGVAEFLVRLRAARDLLTDLRGATRAQAENERAVAAWREEAGRVLAEAGRPVPADDRALLAAVEELAAAARAALETRRQLEAVERRLAALEAERSQARARLDAALAAHADLLRAAGAEDDAAFDRLVADAARRAAQEREVEARWRALHAHLGEGAYGRRLRERLEAGDPQQWEAELQRTRERLARVREERDAAVRAQAAVEREKEELERSADVAAAAAREQALLAELAAAIRSWKVVRLAQLLLNQTLERFVQERQPEVLRVASRVFEQVTGGRYTRVVQDTTGAEGLGVGLVVLEATGARKAPAHLSRGTAEQLYLALRLGLADTFGRRSAALPLVMDDVLVNFDPVRAERFLAALLAYLEEGGRQALLFTCHPETVDRVRRLAPRATLLELPPDPADLREAEVAAAAEAAGSAEAGAGGTGPGIRRRGRAGR